MRDGAPFNASDLLELDGLLELAIGVVPMRDVYAGARDHRIIGLRHDVDNRIEPAVEFAYWEADRGYRSTYYVLHTAPYWSDKTLLRASLEAIAEQGHEIGIHNNALAEHVRTGRDPRELLLEAIGELRGYGYEVSGTVAHGDPACYDRSGQVAFVNDQIFVECHRPDMLVYPDAAPLSAFGLDYDANWIGRAAYLSDSGGHWSKPGYGATRMLFPPGDGQLHMLVHPDWWGEAFTAVTV